VESAAAGRVAAGAHELSEDDVDEGEAREREGPDEQERRPVAQRRRLAHADQAVLQPREPPAQRAEHVVRQCRRPDGAREERAGHRHRHARPDQVVHQSPTAVSSG